jgi:hypothetical protein
MVTLLDHRAHDGSRIFTELPQTVLWEAVRNHISGLRGAELTGFLCDYVTEGWIDFRYRGHSFTINDQFGEYWFFVDDPTCPDDILYEVTNHFLALLASPRSG